MADASKSSVPRPMEGGGAYNRGSRVQAAGLLPAITLLQSSATTADLAPSPQPIIVADYGSSEGRNSLLPIGAAIEILRQRVGGSRAVSVVHTDLPSNDFSVLFEAIASDPDSYATHDANVFPSAVGRTFYEQILPSDTVTLGWTSWAVQWLSRAPTTIPDHVQAAYSQDASVRAAFAHQAAEDWRCFLSHRAREMRSGGRLVVLTMATDDTGDFGYRPLVAAVYDTLCRMVDDGFLSADERLRMTIPTFGRDRAEFAAPFVGGDFEGLSLEQLDIFHAEDRIWAEFGQDGRQFGAKWAAFTRASVFPTLAAALNDQSKTGAFLDRLENGTAERLAAAPERFTIPLAKLVIAKR